MIQVAMFDAINSIEPRYRPYLVQLPATATTSRQAAAAAAAASVLAGLHPQAEADFKAAGAAYLAALPDGDSKAEGIKLGEAIAAKILATRAKDGQMLRIRIGQGQCPVSTSLRRSQSRPHGQT